MTFEYFQENDMPLFANTKHEDGLYFLNAGDDQTSNMFHRMNSSQRIAMMLPRFLTILKER